MEIHARVNGTAVSAAIESHWTLLQMLRDRLELKGAKEGCGVGVCGTCTVLLDGRPVSSCLTLASNADGCEVLTIEGLGAGSSLDPVQQAFLDSTAFQCAFCTSGMIMATKALLATNPDPSEEDVKDYLSGNLCRCGTYIEVLQAVKRARELGTSSS
ncbi:MAG TPA: (2Fe-2S)-binding protein [Methylomirabilota bacterium]|jgi:aerobic-type carbon monoxide dehydrogenase small subunit (CoxS/CutS family)